MTSKIKIIAQDVVDKAEEGVRNFITGKPGSGKTHVLAEAAAIVARHGGRVAFLFPYRLLIHEQHTKLQEFQGIPKERLFRSSDTKLEDPSSFRIFLGTYEAFALRLVKDVTYILDYDLLLLDEFHLIYDPHRGRSVKFIVETAMAFGVPVAKASATITRSIVEKLRKYVDVEEVDLGARPVPIEIITLGNEPCEFRKYAYKHVEIYDIDEFGEPVYYDYEDRRLAEAAFYSELAADVACLLKRLEEQEGRRLQAIIFVEYKYLLENYFKIISKPLRKAGYRVTFHYRVGSTDKNPLNENVEAFIRGEYDVILSTATMAMGINTPADVVVTPVPFHGSVVLTIQALERAGRPGKPKGRGVLYTSPALSRGISQDIITFGVKNAPTLKWALNAFDFIHAYEELTFEELDEAFRYFLGFGPKFEEVDPEKAVENVMLAIAAKNSPASVRRYLAEKIERTPVAFLLKKEEIEKLAKRYGEERKFYGRIRLGRKRYVPDLERKSDFYARVVKKRVRHFFTRDERLIRLKYEDFVEYARLVYVSPYYYPDIRPDERTDDDYPWFVYRRSKELVEKYDFYEEPEEDEYR